MRFKNSLQLIFENFGSVYKVLLYRLIVSAIMMCLAAALIMPNITMIINSAELKDIVALAREFLKSVLSGGSDVNYSEKFNEAFVAFFDFIRLKSTRIILSGVYLILIFLLSRFFSGISNYALGVMVNDHMTSLSHLGFFQSLIKDLKRACLYQLTYLGMTLLYDIAVILLCYFILFGLFSVFGVFAIVMASVAFIFLISLKLTLTGGIMPAMISEGATIKKAVKDSFKWDKKQSPRMLSTYVVNTMLIIFINCAMAVFTLFASLFVTVPLSFLLTICIQFVGHYTKVGKKYYINYDNIVTPKQLREEEKLLDDMDI